MQSFTFMEKILLFFLFFLNFPHLLNDFCTSSKYYLCAESIEYKDVYFYWYLK